MGVGARVVVRQMGSQHRRVGDVPRLLSVDPAAARRAGARRLEIVSPVTTRTAYNVDLLLLQYFYQARCRSSQRIRIRSHSRGRNALACARHRALGTDRFANHRSDVYFRHELRAGIQEAFQLVDNAANVFYGIVYFTMFAIPIFGATEIRSGAPIWLRIAAICGAAVSLSAIYFTVHPIIDVPSTVTFAAKIIAVTAIANAIGVAIYAVGRKRQGT